MQNFNSKTVSALSLGYLYLAFRKAKCVNNLPKLVMRRTYKPAAIKKKKAP